MELKDSSKDTAFCNCIARNDEGVETHGTASSQVPQNLIEDNVANGIRLRKSSTASTANTLGNNVVRNNGANGIVLIEGSTQNTISGNDVRGNGSDGVVLSASDKNKVTTNSVAPRHPDRRREEELPQRQHDHG